MGGQHTLLSKIEKYFKRGALSAIIIVVTSAGFLTYALSDSFIRSQIDYIIGVIEANITAQNLDANSSKNVYIGLREIYKGVVAVLDERIGDVPPTPECATYTDPVERAICETNHTVPGGGTGSGGTGSGSGNTCNDITLSNSQIWRGCDILEQAYSTNICPAGYNIPTAGQWSKLIDSFPGTYVAQLSLTKQYYWTSTNSNNTQEKLLLYIKNAAGTDQLINPGLMTNKLTVRCIKDGSATTSNGQPNPDYTDIPPAPVPYQKNFRKTCEGIQFEGTNRVQNYRWYDTEGKPQDLIQKCSQPNRANGGLICSESANGCCQNGQIAINGTCITPADAGGSCYATSACKDGLSCNNHICVGTATTGSGNNGGGTGTTGTPTVSAMVTGIASTTNPGTFTNQAPQGTNIQLQYNSSNVGNTISFQIFKGTGPLDNSNLATGTSYVQYANLPGNTSGTFNIPLQNMAIGTYRIVVTGCNSANQCVPSPAAVFQVIAIGSPGGGTGGGTGTTVACTGGSQFNFSSNGKNCVGIMPVGPTLNYQTTVNATQGQGNAVVKCTSTGWSVITPNCTVDKNASGGGDTGGGTGGGTGGNPGSDETPNDYQPGTVTPPSGYTDTSCQSTQSWSCPNSTSRSNPPTCYPVSLNSEVSESDLSNANALCYPGYGGPRQVMGLRVNSSNSTVTWFCTEIKADGEKRSEACGAKLKINASCGSQAGAPIVRDSFSLKNTPNLCSKGVPVQTYKYNGGTQFEPYYDYLIESDGTKPSTDPLYPSTWKYKYTCGGVNGGQDAVCTTGPVMESGVCGNTLNCRTGILNLAKGTQFNAQGIATKTYETTISDGKVYWDGEYNWECQGYNGGATVDCRVENPPTTAACGDYNGRSLSSVGGGNYNLWINRTNQNVVFNTSCSGTYPPGATCVSIDYPLDHLCRIPTGYSADATGLLTMVDEAGTDGTFNWKCANMDKMGRPTNETINCSATRIFPGVCGSNNGATLTKIDPATDFYQSWGEPTKLKYCSSGYPNYWENQTEPGKFHWYCYIQGAPNTQCVANYNPAANTPDPVINSLTVNPNSTTFGSYVSVAWTSSNATSCTINMPNAGGVMTDFPGQIANGSLTHMASINGQVTVTATCKNSANETVSRNATYTVSGGGGTGGGGNPQYTYSWSFANNPPWGSCGGNCGPGNGSQIRTAQCLRNDGVVSPGNCNGTAPTESQACTASAGSCTPLSCPEGSMDKYSQNGTKCSYTWGSIMGGNPKRVILSDGVSFAQGYCNTNGTWGNWDYYCKDAAVAIETCSGGGRTFYSADGSNSCYATYEQRNVGSGVTVGNGLTISGGGQGSATCTAGGTWFYSINCPGQTLSCPGGAGELPAVNGDPACIASYNITTAGTWGSGTTNYDGGWVRGYCTPNGAWDAGSITFDCKP